MNDEYIKNISEQIETNNFLKKVNNNLYLRDREIDILERNNIDYQNKNDLSSIIYEIEEILSTYDNEELEWLSKELAERNYYNNTNK